MSRLSALPAPLFLSALVAVAACSTDSNKAADTAAAMAATTGATVDTMALQGDTATTAPTPAPSTTPSAASKSTGDAAIVPININTASDAEILKIPGMGPRMLREFKEYRPFTSIEQFRREIGKYVDKAEVARLEKYIVIK